jgi:hypothetical protein
MIRVSELKLPITDTEPSEQDLIPHICRALGIPVVQLLSHCHG